jgi:hypothetical protein
VTTIQVWSIPHHSYSTLPCKCDTGWTGELPLEVKAVTTIQVWSIPHHSYSTLYHVNVTQDGQVWSIPHHSYSTLYHVNVTQDGQVSYL